MIKKFNSRFIDILIKFKNNTFIFYLFLSVIFIFPIVAITVFSYFKINKELTNAALSRRQAVSYTASVILEEQFNHIINIGRIFASEKVFLNLVREKKWKEAITQTKDIQTGLPHVERIFLTDSNGIMTADIPELPAVVGKDFSFRDWYKGVSKNWEPYVSIIYKRTAEPQYNVVAAAIPIKDVDKILGILVLQVRLDTLFAWSKNITVKDSGFIVFIDKNGNSAGHPKYPPQGEIINYLNILPVQKLLKGERGIEIEFNNIENKKEVFAYEPVKSFGWGVLFEQPEDEVFAMRDEQISFILFIYGLIFILNLFFIYLFSRIFYEIDKLHQIDDIFLESIGDGVAAIDREWNIILWNKTASDLTGWKKEEVMGKPLLSFLKFIQEQTRKENIAFIEEAMLFGRIGTIQGNSVFITKDGKEVPTGDSASPIFDKNGKVNGAIIIFRDTSKEREMFSLRSDFAYASHQIRTPISKALWLAELAIESNDLDKMRDNIKNVYASLKSVHKLGEEIFEVSEIDQNLIIPKFESVKLTHLFEDIFKSVNKKTNIHNVNFKITPISAIASIESDFKLLKRILMEILDNAIIFSHPKNDINISISFPDENILIEIQDFGIGILKEQHPLIFTKFFRGSNFDTTKISGAGLGLFIASQYVKLLKGKIWFKSIEKSGTSFFVLFPIKNK